ncbi:hypothetical protein DPMN_104156 [Dreissena polymorpha]|uniref:Uncharacterized protein n=1 Tax=Dreissena polymorpha TaxID=45954 RepID=A0A9D4JZT7_DREPO|nr:hypothetical protein DPMN_104156 [Dreissena polymorpha]
MFALFSSPEQEVLKNLDTKEFPVARIWGIKYKVLPLPCDKIMSAMRPQRKNFKNLTLEAISGTDLFLKRDKKVFPGTQKKDLCGEENINKSATKDAYNLRRLQRTKDPNVTCVYSAAGALRTSTYSWLERTVQKRGIGEMLPVWVGS